MFCNLGNFYVAVGKDAVCLNKELGLKLSCFKEEMCKIGFPIASLEKYTDLIEQKHIGYVVYYFDKKNINLEVLKEYKGKKKIEETVRSNCYICSKGTEKYKKTDKYMLALAKLYEEEDRRKIQLNESKRKRKIWFKKKKKKID